MLNLTDFCCVSIAHSTLLPVRVAAEKVLVLPTVTALL